MFGKDAHGFFKEVARRVKLATDDDFAYQSLYFGGSPEGEHGCRSRVLWGEKWCVRGGRLPSVTYFSYFSYFSYCFVVVFPFYFCMHCFLVLYCLLLVYCILYCV